MAKTSYINLLPETELKFFSGLQSGDRFVSPRIRMKTKFFSRKRKKGISQRSLLPQIAEIWNAFSDELKNEWSEAGQQMGLNGWRLFVQDQCFRIINELPDTATPSLLHQSFVGNLYSDENGNEIKITQIHPHYYYTSKKIKGSKNSYEPVLIEEDLSLPVELSFNYSSDLICLGRAAIYGTANYGVAEYGDKDAEAAKIYCRFWHSYQGADRYSELCIDLDYISDWKNASVTLTELIGYVIRYDIYAHLKGLHGNIYFDNIKVKHNDQNWVRDTNCKDIDQGFTRAFYQVPKHWFATIIQDGTWFGSIYKDF